MATFDPTTSFNWSSIPKHWARFRLDDALYSSNDISFLSPGLRVTTALPAAAVDYSHQLLVSSDAASANGTFCGLTAAGWGYGSSTPTTLELQFANMAVTAHSVVESGVGIALKVPAYESITNQSPAFKPNYLYLVVAFVVDYNGTNGDNRYTFYWINPYGSDDIPNFTRIGASSSVPDINIPDTHRVRVLRTAIDTYEGQYWDGASWATLGTFTGNSFWQQEYVEPVLYVKGTVGSGGGNDIDVTFTQLTQVAGSPIPAIQESLSDSFTGSLPEVDNPNLWAFWHYGWKAPYFTTNQQALEPGGYLSLTSLGGSGTTSTKTGGYRSRRVIYPGTDIELITDLSFHARGTGSGGGSAVIGFTNQNFDFEDNKSFLFAIQNTSGSNYFYRTFAQNDGAATQINTSAALGAPPLRTQIRMTRVNNVWSVYYDDTLSSNWTLFSTWTDTNNYLTNHPITLIYYNSHSLSNSEMRFYSISLTGDTKLVNDTNAPTLTNEDPTRGASGIGVWDPITFSLNDDDSGVVITTVIITIDGEIIFNGTSFLGNWTGSSYVANLNNGYDFTLVSSAVLQYGTDISINVTAQDDAGNSLSDGYVITTLDQPSQFLRSNFTVPSIDVAKSPRSIFETNQFDNHGSLLSLPRIRDEKNWAYRRRMLDVFSHVANSGYRGLVHGITRELGLSLISPITIDPKVDGNERFLAPDPYIKFDGAYVYLYSDFTNDLLDYKIDRFEPGGNYEQISRLIDLVNTTAYFEANLIPGYDGQARSMTILNQSNREIVAFELVQPSNRFRLEHKHIVPGTLFFSNRDLFKTEVYSEDAVDSQGKYYINYLEGIVTSYSIAVGLDYVRYQYVRYPFRPVASPIILCDINMNSFKDKMFELINDADNNEIHGLPTEIGVDIINELLEVTPMYWGV